MLITIVERTLEGYQDSDYPPLVYEGHLDEAAIRAMAEFEGAIGRGGYARVAVIRDGDDWLASYCNQDEEPDGEDGQYEDKKGDLELRIQHASTLRWSSPG